MLYLWISKHKNKRIEDLLLEINRENSNSIAKYSNWGISIVLPKDGNYLIAHDTLKQVGRHAVYWYQSVSNELIKLSNSSYELTSESSGDNVVIKAGSDAGGQFLAIRFR